MKVKINEAIFGDYRKEEVKEAIQEKLKSIPMLSKYQDVDEIPLNTLEKFLWKLCGKFGVTMQYIMPVSQPGGPPYYSCSFKTTDKHEWIGTVNGILIYEIFAKGVLMVYSYARKNT